MARLPSVTAGLILTLLACSLAAAAPNDLADSSNHDITMRVRVGWFDQVRMGRWSPVYVTLSDAGASDVKPRSVRLDVEAMQAGPAIMQISQYATISRREVMFTLVLPIRGEDGEDFAVTLRDADSGKTLAKWPPEDKSYGRFYSSSSNSETRYVGVVGNPNGDYSHFNDELNGAMSLAHIAYEKLPEQPLGYDSLDLLILHRPNLNAISKDKQQAIADWVRQGGCILMSPGDEAAPPGPLSEILPARIGQPKDLPLSQSQRDLSNLSQNLTVFHGFDLQPAGPDVTPIRLFLDNQSKTDILAYSRRVGFGRIVIAPFDLSLLRFRYSHSSTTISDLTGGLGLREDRPSTSGGFNYYSGGDPLVRRQDHAGSLLQDHLAEIPGAGRFGFSYVAWVVFGMMVLVGPVDWFVLKRLGRQPWTWVTTAGWIGLITVIALYIGKVFKSGELHFRTIELVDQADDRVISRTTLAGIYAPRTTVYHIDGASTQKDAAGNLVSTKQPPGGWWNPAAMDGYFGREMRSDIQFHQTVDGNAPEGMTINVWNLRFIRGEMNSGGEPMVKAELNYCIAAGGLLAVKGTVRNVSDRTLTDVRIQIGDSFAGERARPRGFYFDVNDPTTNSDNSAKIDWPQAEREWARLVSGPVIIPKLAAGEQATIDAPAAASLGVASESAGNSNRYYGNETSPPEKYTWTIAGDLNARRSWRAKIEAQSMNAAIVYATIADPSPTVAIRESGAKEKHEAFLRALVPLKHEKDVP